MNHSAKSAYRHESLTMGLLYLGIVFSTCATLYFTAMCGFVYALLFFFCFEFFPLAVFSLITVRAVRNAKYFRYMEQERILQLYDELMPRLEK